MTILADALNSLARRSGDCDAPVWYYRSQRGPGRSVIFEYPRARAALTSATTYQIVVLVGKHKAIKVVEVTIFRIENVQNVSTTRSLGCDLCLFEVVFSLHGQERLYASSQWLGPASSLLPLLPRDLLVCFAILARSLLGYLLGHAYTILALESGVREPVAQMLLVVARLAFADLILVLGPKARAVWREDLVNEDDLLRLWVKAKLELGICDNNATLLSVIAGLQTRMSVLHNKGISVDGETLTIS